MAAIYAGIFFMPSHGRKSAELLSKKRFNLVLMDIQICGMDGMTFPGIDGHRKGADNEIDLTGGAFYGTREKNEKE